ncbi:Nn.00g077830.m01.CDS01 [Neocucurbitaria sp. VM-36]
MLFYQEEYYEEDDDEESKTESEDESEDRQSEDEECGEESDGSNEDLSSDDDDNEGNFQHCCDYRCGNDYNYGEAGNWGISSNLASVFAQAQSLPTLSEEVGEGEELHHSHVNIVQHDI